MLSSESLFASITGGRQRPPPLGLPTLIAKAAEVSKIPSMSSTRRRTRCCSPSTVSPSESNEELSREGLAAVCGSTRQRSHLRAPDLHQLERSRYATVLRNLETLTGRSFRQITILGGGSRNTLLSRLTQEKTPDRRHIVRKRKQLGATRLLCRATRTAGRGLQKRLQLNQPLSYRRCSLQGAVTHQQHSPGG